MHGLQRLMGCILPTMHYRCQHCWELLHPFAHHCQHAPNNSQHCWRNIGSCCIHLHAALQGKWWEEVRKLKQQAAMITSLWFYSALMISELQYFNWPIYNTQPSSLKCISCWFFRPSLVWQDTKTSNVLQSETFTDNIQDSQENAKTQSCKSSV